MTSSDVVEAVVLNWRAPDQAGEAAAALLASEGVDIGVTVVDNGSGDGSVERLASRLGPDRVVALKENGGYAAGMNAGLDRALEGEAEAVLLVTQDTVVAADAVSEMVAALLADPGLGVVGPVVYYGDRSDEVFSAGAMLEPDRASSRAVRPGPGSSPYDVDTIDGCCMLLRRAMVERLGRLDPRYFMYYEETEYCRRARQAGWRIAVVPGARAWQSRPVVPGAHYFYYMARNRYLFWGEGYGVPSRVVTRAHLVETVRLAAWAGSTLLRPWRWSAAPDRFRRLSRQIRGLFRGIRDHEAGKYGKQSHARA